MADEVVVGATAKDFVLEVVDEAGLPINVTGMTFALQGTSPDLPSTTIDAAGTVTDGAQGVVTWTGVGAYVDGTDMGSVTRAGFAFRVKKSAGGEYDWGPEFAWDYVAAPDVA
jgi:hypothetical protein